MGDDLKTAIRWLRSAPTFTTVALIVLSLGIGAGTAVFSVVDAVVLRALPFDEHDRLVAVLEHDTKRPTTFGDGATTTQMFLDWRAQQQPFQQIAAVGNTRFRLHTESGEPADSRATRMTHEFLPVLRVTPMLGRNFGPDDEIEGRHRVVILSYGFWQRRYGGDPAAVGKTLELDERPWEIVGVMPRGFAYPVASDKPAELYVPISFKADDKVRGGSHNYNFTAIARLKDGASVDEASQRMQRLAEALDAQYPKWGPGRTVRVVALHEHLVGKVKSWMLMLLAAVALVMLIACANVANLMLARATVRAHEMGIRAALGAGRARLIRGLLVEGLVLSCAGAAIGVLLASAGVQIIRSWLPGDLPRVAAIGIDLRVLLAATGAALATGMLFGIVPALQSSRPDLASALKDQGRSATSGARSQRLRSLLVIAEVALAVVLLVGAGLFTASFARLTSIDPGFDHHNVLALNVSPKFEVGKWEAAMKVAVPYTQQMIDAVRHVEGVESVAAVAGGLPLTGSWSRTRVEVVGRGEFKDDDSIDTRTVSPDYLQTMRIPLKRGRYLGTEDSASSQPVAVVNEAAARKYWPGEDPLGQRVKINGKERLVVGIVGDIRHLGPEVPPRQECYVPMGQEQFIGSTLVIRTAGSSMRVLPAVKAAIWGVNKEQRLTADTLTLEGHMDRLIAQRRFNMALLALFGGLGLVIAAVGIYGLMAYVVAQRTGEIGVRMALGATRGRMVGMVLGRAGVLMSVGLVVGVGVAWAFGSGLKTFLFEIEPNDLRVFAGAVATIIFAGLLATIVPAHRAATVDPLVALRQG